jgi:hypothetical protein
MSIKPLIAGLALLATTASAQVSKDLTVLKMPMTLACGTLEQVLVELMDDDIIPVIRADGLNDLTVFYATNEARSRVRIVTYDRDTDYSCIVIGFRCANGYCFNTALGD